MSGDEALMVLFGFHKMSHFSDWFQSVDKDQDGSLTEHELEEWLLRHHADDSRTAVMRLQHIDDDAEAAAVQAKLDGVRAELESNIASLQAQLSDATSSSEEAAKAPRDELESVQPKGDAAHPACSQDL